MIRNVGYGNTYSWSCLCDCTCVRVCRASSVGGWLVETGTRERETRDVHDDDVGVVVFGVVSDRSTMGSGTRKRFAEKRRGASVREQDDDG
jgi:hypothetical protein